MKATVVLLSFFLLLSATSNVAGVYYYDMGGFQPWLQSLFVEYSPQDGEFVTGSTNILMDRTDENATRITYLLDHSYLRTTEVLVAKGHIYGYKEPDSNSLIKPLSSRTDFFTKNYLDFTEESLKGVKGLSLRINWKRAEGYRNSKARGFQGKDGAYTTFFREDNIFRFMPIVAAPDSRVRFLFTLNASHGISYSNATSGESSDLSNKTKPIILGNLEAGTVDNIYYSFPMTPIPIATHDLAFAYLHPDVFHRSKCVIPTFFGQNITFFNRIKDRHVFDGKYDIESPDVCAFVKNVIYYTYTYCMSNIGPKKRWPKLDILIIPLEHRLSVYPGLVSIKEDQSYIEFIECVIYAIAHEYLSPIMGQKTFVETWMEEGLIQFVKREILRELHELKHMSDDLYDISAIFLSHHGKSSYVSETNIEEITEEDYSFATADFRHNPEFHNHAANAMAQLNIAMDGHLLRCIQRPPGFGGQKDLHTKDSILNHLRQCHLSEVDVPHFLEYWLHESPIPVLKIKFDETNQGSSQTIIMSHFFICRGKEVWCSPKDKTNVHLGFTLMDVHGKIVAPSVVYEGSSYESKKSYTTQIDYKPDFFKDFFMANAKGTTNFLVQYPDWVYENFIVWFDNLCWTAAYSKKKLNYALDSLSKNLAFFFFDWFELSKRGVISSKWFIELVKRFRWFSKIGFYDRSEFSKIQEFETLCLGSYVSHYLDQFDQSFGDDMKLEFYEFFCQHANKPPKELRKAKQSVKGLKECKWPLDFKLLTGKEYGIGTYWVEDCRNWIEQFLLSQLLLFHQFPEGTLLEDTKVQFTDKFRSSNLYCSVKYSEN